MAAIPNCRSKSIRCSSPHLPSVTARRSISTAPKSGLRRAGHLSRVTLQGGEHIEAGDPVFALVKTDEYWVQVNIKEVKLTHLKVGQTATIVLDAYPNVTWDAEVESISPATGAEFSVLPAQNATGNWVKVVQRVPLRLKLADKPNAPPLRAGMTATISIDTGFERNLTAIASTLLSR